ncbi:MAG: hypothetical protein ACXAC7_18025 [Candidatus Hodarchaeales archaeon]
MKTRVIKKYLYFMMLIGLGGVLFFQGGIASAVVNEITEDHKLLYQGFAISYGIVEFEEEGVVQEFEEFNINESWTDQYSYEMDIPLVTNLGDEVATIFSYWYSDVEGSEKYGNAYFEASDSLSEEFKSKLFSSEGNTIGIDNYYNEELLSIMDLITEFENIDQSYEKIENSVITIEIYDVSTFNWLGTTTASDITINLLNTNGDTFGTYYFTVFYQLQDSESITIPVLVEWESNGYYHGIGNWSYNYDYELEGLKAYVSIEDDGNLEMQYEANLKNHLTYTESGSNYEDFKYLYSDSSSFTALTNLEVTINDITYNFVEGELIPEDLIPWSSNSTYSEEGERYHSWSSTVTHDSLSAAQSVTQVINPPDLDGAAMIWSNSFPTVLTARNMNWDNNIEPEGVDTGSTISYSPHDSAVQYDENNYNFPPGIPIIPSYLGELEVYAIQESYTMDFYQNYNYNDPINDLTDPTSVNIGFEPPKRLPSSEPSPVGTAVPGSDPNADPDMFVWEYSNGDVNKELDVSLDWEDPKYENNVVTFAWTLNFNDFPSIWSDDYFVNKWEVPMDLSFGYIYEIDLSLNNQMRTHLSTTYEFNKIIGEFFEELQDYSLIATTYSTWYTEDEITSDVLSGSSMLLDDITFKINEIEIAEIIFGESKKTYQLYTSENSFEIYNTSTEIISLVSPLATFDSGEVSAFSSETRDLVGVANIYSMAEENVEFTSPIYAEMMITTTYPKWDGNRIVHDPTFTAISGAHKTLTEHPSLTNQASSGFTLLPVIGFLIIIGIISYRHKR